MELNMEKSVVEKLEDISKKQSTDLVVPPQEKLKQLSKVVNNDKMLDIIRGKNFAEFTEKEIKDVDIVRSRFNSFVNDYYQLLDMFYTYKKNKEKGEKEDISILLKQEKQIEQLKNRYQSDWEACRDNYGFRLEMIIILFFAIDTMDFWENLINNLTLHSLPSFHSKHS